MKTSERFFGTFEAVLLCLILLTKHRVDSVQLSAPEVVTATHGGSVTVSCQYDLAFRENTKYWCRGPVYDLCSIVVKTPRNRPSNRTFITDDTEAGVFTVVITSLRDTDDNVYWCVISTSGRNIHTRVRLRISHTVTTPTTATTTTEAYSLLTPKYGEISWWATLRWILFILMLCCLVSTHIAVWRMSGASKINEQQQFHHQNSNIYE